MSVAFTPAIVVDADWCGCGDDADVHADAHCGHLCCSEQFLGTLDDGRLVIEADDDAIRELSHDLHAGGPSPKGARPNPSTRTPDRQDWLDQPF